MDEQWGFVTKHRGDYADFNERWKVLTVWMTANDVCGQCNGPVDNATLSSWVGKIDELLTNVSTTMQNVYVSLSSTLDLSNVARIQRSSLYCSVEHKVILKECGCIDRGNATQLAQLDANIHTYDSALHDLAQKWYEKLQAAKRTDMAVVMQSFLEGVGPELNKPFLNNLDCFHPSALGHQDLAVGLWNSMLCPGPQRKNKCGQHSVLDLKLMCPTADSVFYTGPDVRPDPPPPTTPWYVEHPELARPPPSRAATARP